jgi:glycosyltransferase involved in cell wall biosynthesis
MKIIKKILPKKIKKSIKDIIYERRVCNVYKKSYRKKVLISYIVSPFRKKSLSHTNFYEVTSAAKIFDELGYVVDVIYYQGKIPKLEEYDVIYGFGDVFQEYFESGLWGKKTIYYGAGMHVCHQNTATLKRVKDVYKEKGIWLAKSARYVEKNWSHQTILVDGIIALGNEECAKTYRKYYDGKIISLPAPFFKVIDADSVLKNRSRGANKSYLWFGSGGLVHKGLDLCLDFFKKRPDLTLHICGNIESEIDFLEAYKDELYQLPNILTHGFLQINSISFKEVLSLCSFVIFPSCSEGGGPAVLTSIGNGALIPIITKETSISTGNEIVIDNLSLNAISKAIEYSQNLTNESVLELQKNNLRYVLNEHNQEIYFVKLKKAIEEILSDEM